MKNKKINIVISYIFLIALVVFVGFIFYQISPKHLVYIYLPILIWGVWYGKRFE